METTSTTPNFRAMDIAELEQTNGGSIKTTIRMIIESILKPGTLWA